MIYEKPNRKHTDVSPVQMTILRSSETLSWQGIVLEQRQHSAGEYSFPALSAHMLCLYQGLPLSLEQLRNGHLHTGTLLHGGIQIVPVKTESTWRHREEVNNIHVHLSPDLLNRVAAELKRPHLEILDHWNISDPRIEHISLALLAELAAGGPSGRLYGEGLATALAAHLIQSYSSTPQSAPELHSGLPDPLFKRLVTMIEDRLHEDLGLADLAGEARLSQSHFSSLFRQTTGISPHRYIVRRRVERALSLLQSTSLPPSDIAAAVGFYDQSHLIRHMRHLLGVTPKYVRDHLSSGKR